MLRPQLSLKAWAGRPVQLSERTALAMGLLGGVILRIVQIATSVGSVDAFFWTRHVELVEKFGVLRAYHAAIVINHPPFSLWIALWTGRLGALAGLQFFDAFRILQSVADIVTMFALLRIGRRVAPQSALWIALVFFLSPATIFISAFHCNSDPLMIMFIVLAVLAVIEERPVLAGLLLGAATGIKIIALPAIPLLLLGIRGWKARLQFLLAASVIGAAIFVPAFLVSGWVAIRNIFGYTGWRGGWGLPLILDLAGLPRVVPGDPARFVTPLLLVALVMFWCAEAWRTRIRGALDPERIPKVIGVAFLLVLFFATGFMPHYFFWFLPWLGFFQPRRAVLALHGLSSLFLFWLYTSWAGEWPWVYANGGQNSAAVGVFGLIVWASIGAFLVLWGRALYRSPS